MFIEKERSGVYNKIIRDMLEELTYKVYRLEDECAVAHAKITELEEERENA